MRLARSASALASLGIALLLAATSAQSHVESRPMRRAAALQPIDLADTATPTTLCGHLDDLASAWEALESGDRETALVHLRAARRLLTTCDARLQTERSERAEPDAAI